MTRGKTNLAYIENDADGRAFFNKRQRGLMKKANELNTLCGVETCAIIYGPHEKVPVLWTLHACALAAIDHFNQLSEMDWRMFDQDEFIHQRIKKLREKVNCLHQEYKIKEMETFMYPCIIGQNSVKNLKFEYVGPLRHVIGQIMRTVESGIEENGIGNSFTFTMVGPVAFAYGYFVPPENFAEPPFPPSG